MDNDKMTWAGGAVVFVLLLLGILLVASTGFWRGGYWGNGGYGMMNGGFGGFMLFCPVVLFILLAFFLFMPRRRWRMMGEPDAMEIVKRRYARGEIKKEEYDALKKDLSE